MYHTLVFMRNTFVSLLCYSTDTGISATFTRLIGMAENLWIRQRAQKEKRSNSWWILERNLVAPWTFRRLKELRLLAEQSIIVNCTRHANDERELAIKQLKNYKSITNRVLTCATSTSFNSRLKNLSRYFDLPPFCFYIVITFWLGNYIRSKLSIVQYSSDSIEDHRDRLELLKCFLPLVLPVVKQRI